MTCPNCGLTSQHQSLVDCINELKKCHHVSVKALLKIRGIVRAFTQSPAVIKQVEKIVDQALTDLGGP